MCWGTGRSTNATSGNHYFAVAVQKSVIVYQIDRSEKRHRKLWERAVPGQAQTLKIWNGKLIMGYPSSFRMFDLLDKTQTCKFFYQNFLLFFSFG